MARINTQTARDTKTNLLASAATGSPGTDMRWTALKVSASYQGTGTSGVLQIISRGAVDTVLWELDVDADTGVLEDFRYPLRARAEEQLVATLTASGTGVVGRVNLQYALER